MPFDRQLTLDGGAVDIPRRHEQDRLFNAPRTIRGQLALERKEPLSMNPDTIRAAIDLAVEVAAQESDHRTRFNGGAPRVHADYRDLLAARAAVAEALGPELASLIEEACVTAASDVRGNPGDREPRTPEEHAERAAQARALA